MATDKDEVINPLDNKPDTKTKGFKSGLSDNSTLVGSNKTENISKDVLAKKNTPNSAKEKTEDTTALHDDEDVEKQ